MHYHGALACLGVPGPEITANAFGAKLIFESRSIASKRKAEPTF